MSRKPKAHRYRKQRIYFMLKSKSKKDYDRKSLVQKLKNYLKGL